MDRLHHRHRVPPDERKAGSRREPAALLGPRNRRDRASVRRHLERMVVRDGQQHRRERLPCPVEAVDREPSERPVGAAPVRPDGAPGEVPAIHHPKSARKVEAVPAIEALVSVVDPEERSPAVRTEDLGKAEQRCGGILDGQEAAGRREEAVPVGGFSLRSERARAVGARNARSFACEPVEVRSQARYRSAVAGDLARPDPLEKDEDQVRSDSLADARRLRTARRRLEGERKMRVDPGSPRCEPTDRLGGRMRRGNRCHSPPGLGSGLLGEVQRGEQDAVRRRYRFQLVDQEGEAPRERRADEDLSRGRPPPPGERVADEDRTEGSDGQE